MRKSSASRGCAEGTPTNRFRGRWRLIVIALLLGTACAKAGTPGGPPTSGGREASLQALKLAVLDAVGGDLVYCDPDQYPIPRGTPLENARARFPTIRADRPAFDAILEREHLSATQRFTPNELITINEDYKQMQAIQLEPDGEEYRFSVQVPGPSPEVAIQRLSGVVDRSGDVSIERRAVGRQPACPICLAAGVRIATPNGEIPVQDVRVGMRVWTVDARGNRVAGVVLATGHMEAPLGHEVVRLTLEDGRTVSASPGHPTADGRTIGDLQPGDRFEGSVVASATVVTYTGATWDLLPSGSTGTYLANGVLLRSTLSLAPRGVRDPVRGPR